MNLPPASGRTTPTMSTLGAPNLAGVNHGATPMPHPPRHQTSHPAVQARIDGIRIARLMIRLANAPSCGVCGGPHHAKGLCRKHYGVERRQTSHANPGPKPLFDWAACGTPAQYRKHLLHAIPMCESCRRAENRRVQDREKNLKKLPNVHGKSGNGMIE